MNITTDIHLKYAARLSNKWGPPLSMAKDAADIIPAAYRLRTKMAPLRKRISEHGLDEKLDRYIRVLSQQIVKRKMIFSEGVKVPVSSLKIPIDGHHLDWLYKPYYFGKKKYLNSISTIVNRYYSIISLTERIEKLAGY